MFDRTFRTCLLPLSLIAAVIAPTIAAQTPAPTAPITLNVVVQDKSGNPVTGLQQADFSLLDNKSPRTITGFKAVTAAQEPVRVILVVDDISTPFENLTNVRNEITRYLRSSGGHLPYPTAIAMATESDTKVGRSFSTDGNGLADSLAKDALGLRPVNNSGGGPGASQLLQDELTSFRKLLFYCSTFPGRKIVIWFAPGWPLLVGTRHNLNEAQHNIIFHEVADFSTQMRNVNMTLYNVNPMGTANNQFIADYYRGYLGGVSHPYQTEVADVSLQVQTTHSGGMVMNSSTDLAALLAQCLHDLDSWYEITFTPAAAAAPDEYHQLEIKLDKPHLTARTRDSYYVQPAAAITASTKAP